MKRAAPPDMPMARQAPAMSREAIGAGTGPTLAPLYVDLDGTLIATDLLHESVLLLARRSPFDLFRIPFWLAAGKARMKQEIAHRVAIDASGLPYRQEVLDLITEARSRGRRIVLATASDLRYATAVAEHLGVFDAVLASDGCVNLGGGAKLAAIEEDAGGTGQAFCYVGDNTVDIPIWQRASETVVVEHAGIVDRVERATTVHRILSPRRATLRDYLYGIRIHQWVKNLLIALPMLPIMRSVTGEMTFAALVAFAVFSLMASSVYIVNDLLDLAADRHHARKKHRPFAAGLISIPRALVLAAGMTVLSLSLAIRFLSPAFLVVLFGYVALTTWYSFGLKHRTLVDVFALSMLYMLRIIAGAAAIEIPPSFWILCFSLFVFTSLALAKRYVELESVRSSSKEKIASRDYRVTDQTFVMIAGVASGHVSVLVLSLYIVDPSTTQRYVLPQALWVLGPLFFYWITRVWLKANRGELHDDPIVFAIRDRISRFILALGGVAYAVAAWGLQ
jgi:4-hydroxybenzoate polyprenyltransferase/phosphoserine phosphatase